MLRDLPDNARYTAVVLAERDLADDEEVEEETDPLIIARRDRRTWHLDRQLIAQLINSTNLLVRVTGHWEKGNEPEFATVGPASWSADNNAGGEPTLEQVLALFG